MLKFNFFNSFKSPKTQEEDDVRIAAIECIWGCICEDTQNENRFFQAGGGLILFIKLLTDKRFRNIFASKLVGDGFALGPKTLVGLPFGFA